MPKHTENALTDRNILHAKSKDKQYKIFDGKGLFVLIHPNGSKYFRWEYKFEGKRKTLALGVHPETTLKLARDERLEAHKLVHEGSDPVNVRRKLKSEKKFEQELDHLSFENVAMEWWKRQSLNQTVKHAREARRSLENHVFPHIGFKRIDEITTKEVKSLLLDLEGQGKGETAHRVQQRLRSVFQYAIMQEWTDRNPASDLHKLLNPVKKQQMKGNIIWEDVINWKNGNDIKFVWEVDRANPKIKLPQEFKGTIMHYNDSLRLKIFNNGENFITLALKSL